MPDAGGKQLHPRGPPQPCSFQSQVAAEEEQVERASLVGQETAVIIELAAGGDSPSAF